jgi:hypothetical protein
VEKRDAKAERADSDVLERLESAAEQEDGAGESGAHANGAAMTSKIDNAAGEEIALPGATAPSQFAPPSLPGGSKSP